GITSRTLAALVFGSIAVKACVRSDLGIYASYQQSLRTLVAWCMQSLCYQIARDLQSICILFAYALRA
ncbi:hypothetical protein ACWGY7_23910, partial [Xanthomonas axonopodis pv. khayae]